MASILCLGPTRVTRGAISLSSSQQFPAHAEFESGKTSGVAAWPRQTCHEAAADRVDGSNEHDRHAATCLLQYPDNRPGRGHNHIRRERDQFCRVFAKAIEITRAPAIVDPHVAADGPTVFLQPLCEGGDERWC